MSFELTQDEHRLEADPCFGGLSPPTVDLDSNYKNYWLHPIVVKEFCSGKPGPLVTKN